MNQHIEIIGDKPHLLSIDAVYAYIASDEEGEGIMGCSMVLGGARTMVPMIGADLERIKSLKPHAEEISRVTGKPYKLVKFDRRTDLDVSDL